MRFCNFQYFSFVRTCWLNHTLGLIYMNTYVNKTFFCFTGIAINKEGVIYIADGANIRKIDTDGIISTVIGSQDQPRSWKPISCDESMPADQVLHQKSIKFI